MMLDIEYVRQYEPIDGKWYAIKELGQGAFGSVFEIQRKDFPEMRAALKVIAIPQTSGEIDSFREENYDLDEKSITSYFYGFVEEFVKEFQIMSKMKGHSNIVSYEDHDIIPHKHDVGWDIFIRMELLTSLGKYFAGSTPARAEIIKLGIDICKALEICQKYNIIHRDIKPNNIFVSETGDFKLGDFGVARTMEKTASGLSKKGTYTYMAPEVYKGNAYNANVDIYSLGIVMYKLLNNNMEPFRTERTYDNSIAALESRMSGIDMPRPANADEALSDIILKACCYEPDKRYSTPTQMREELEELLSGKTENKIITEQDEKLKHEPPDENLFPHEDGGSARGRRFSPKSISGGIVIAVAMLTIVAAIMLFTSLIKKSPADDAGETGIDMPQLLDGTLASEYDPSTGHYAVIKTNGDQSINITQALYSHVSVYGKDALVCEKNKWGVIDENGKFTVPLEYDSIDMSYMESLGFIIAEKNGLYGTIDIDNNEHVPLIYSNLKITESRKYFICCRNEKYGVIDLIGTSKIPCDYEYIREILNNDAEEEYFIIKFNDKEGVLDVNDHTIVHTIYGKIKDRIYAGKYLILRKEDPDTYGVIDINNENIPFIPFEYGQISYVKERQGFQAEKADGTIVEY